MRKSFFRLNILRPFPSLSTVSGDRGGYKISEYPIILRAKSYISKDNKNLKDNTVGIFYWVNFQRCYLSGNDVPPRIMLLTKTAAIKYSRRTL